MVEDGKAIIMSQTTEHMFFGVHVIGELYGVDSKLLNDQELLEKTLEEGIKTYIPEIRRLHGEPLN